MEKAVFMLKPGAGHLEEEVLTSLAALGLRVLACRSFTFSVELLLQFYTHGEQRFKENFRSFMCSGPCKMFLVEGTGAIQKCMQLRAQIRQKYGVTQPNTLVHAADNVLEAENEAEMILSRVAGAL